MRYDTIVTFYHADKKYDPRISGYRNRDTVLREQMANVTSLGTNRQIEIFGALKSHQKTIRLMERPPSAWSFLMLENDDTHYKLSTEIQTLKGYAMIVGASDGN